MSANTFKSMLKPVACKILLLRIRQNLWRAPNRADNRKAKLSLTPLRIQLRDYLIEPIKFFRMNIEGARR